MQRYYADEYGYKPEVRAFYEGYLNLVTDDDEKRYLGSLTAVSTDGGKNLFRAERASYHLSARTVRDGRRKTIIYRQSFFR